MIAKGTLVHQNKVVELKSNVRQFKRPLEQMWLG
jgi:hypothetical protein